jgi:hypothetical protein
MIFAELSFSQLSDHPSLTTSLAESGAILPGTQLRGLLVLLMIELISLFFTFQ